MPRKLFLSFLGTGLYQECTYYNDNFNAKPTRFIQKATLELLTQQGSKPDAVRIFTTRKAKESNWYGTMKSRKQGNIDIPYYGLESAIGNMSPDIKAVDVPDGANEAEMWTIFQKVYDELEEGDELHIDLTHAFRYLPMLMLVLSNYAKFLLHITVGSITYGNYEARDKDTNRAPIISLRPLTQLQEWTNATSEFIRNGYAERLKDCIKNSLLPYLKDKQLRTENVTNVNKLGQAIDAFTKERITCRGLSIAEGTASKTLLRLLNEIEDTDVKALNPIFEELKHVIRLNSDESSRCHAAAQWCYERQLYQQAITILQEGINTFFCKRNGIDIADDQERKYVGTAFKVKENELKGKKSDIKEEKNAIVEKLLGDEILRRTDVINHYTDISGTRNDYNHAGFRKKRAPLQPKQIIKKIKEALDFFKPILVDNSYRQASIKKRVFVNLSNHPSESWENCQIEAAKKYGNIVDMNFPPIAPDSTEEDVHKLALQTADNIITQYGKASVTVHVMGEMTFAYDLINILKNHNIKCVASTTTRDTDDNKDGSKLSRFHFVKFREY